MPLLRPDEAARRLNIWSMTKAGEVPHIKLGKSVRYRSEDIDAWLARLAAESVR